MLTDDDFQRAERIAYRLGYEDRELNPGALEVFVPDIDDIDWMMLEDAYLIGQMDFEDGR